MTRPRRDPRAGAGQECQASRGGEAGDRREYTSTDHPRGSVRRSGRAARHGAGWLAPLRVSWPECDRLRSGRTRVDDPKVLHAHSRRGRSGGAHPHDRSFLLAVLALGEDELLRVEGDGEPPGGAHRGPGRARHGGLAGLGGSDSGPRSIGRRGASPRPRRGAGQLQGIGDDLSRRLVRGAARFAPGGRRGSGGRGARGLRTRGGSHPRGEFH